MVQQVALSMPVLFRNNQNLAYRQRRGKTGSRRVRARRKVTPENKCSFQRLENAGRRKQKGRRGPVCSSVVEGIAPFRPREGPVKSVTRGAV